MQYTVRKVNRLVKLKKKLLVYADWPGNVWLMKTLFDVLGFNAARISAGQSAKERQRDIKAFNNLDNCTVKILVASS